MNQLSEVQGIATETELLKEFRKQCATIPERLLGKLKDTLQSNRSQIHVLTARILRLEAAHNDMASTSHTTGTQLKHKPFDCEATGRRCKVNCWYSRKPHKTGDI